MPIRRPKRQSITDSPNETMEGSKSTASIGHRDSMEPRRSERLQSRTLKSQGRPETWPGVAQRELSSTDVIFAKHLQRPRLKTSGNQLVNNEAPTYGEHERSTDNTRSRRPKSPLSDLTGAAKKAVLRTRLDTVISKIKTEHANNIKLRDERRSIWNIIQDCEETIHVEERHIYMRLGRNRSCNLDKLKKLKEKCRRHHTKAADRQELLKRSYKRVEMWQLELLEIEEELSSC